MSTAEQPQPRRLNPTTTNDQLALLCVPCKYHGSEEPSSGSGAVRVCVSRDADVSALRAAVAAQLEPKTSGFGPWRQTLSAEPGQIHFFVSGGSDGTELVPVTQGVAQIAQQSSNEAVLYYTIEGQYGDEDLLICCAICACCVACCTAIWCCCSKDNENNTNGNNNNNQGEYQQNPLNGQGYTNQGYKNQGYNNQGYNSQGYNNQGYNNQGYNNQGYNNQGYNNQGYNNQGYNQGAAGTGYGAPPQGYYN